MTVDVENNRCFGLRNCSWADSASGNITYTFERELCPR